MIGNLHPTDYYLLKRLSNVTNIEHSHYENIFFHVQWMMHLCPIIIRYIPRALSITLEHLFVIILYNLTVKPHFVWPGKSGHGNHCAKRNTPVSANPLLAFEHRTSFMVTQNYNCYGYQKGFPWVIAHNDSNNSKISLGTILHLTKLNCTKPN